jgi:hypothetical protein
MATRYWVGGSGNWDATSTANWSTSSGGASGASAPTSADDVIFDASSNVTTGAFTVTVTGTSSAPAVCNDFSTGGAGGALDGAMTLSMGATAELHVYGSLTLPATNFTWTTTDGGILYFKSTTTGKTFTTNGVSMGNTRCWFDGVGGAWTLGSAFTSSLSSISAFYLFNGTINTGNYNITAVAIRLGNGNTCAFNAGSSTLAFSGSTPLTLNTTGLTFNAGTSQITCSATSPTFAGSGLTFYNVSFTSTSGGTTTITGANTFNNLSITSRGATGIKSISIGDNQTVSGTLTLGAANTSIRRMHLFSSTIGTQRTITLNGTLATLSDVDFRDIATAGTVGTWTGTRLGNALNNSGITFDAGVDKYWNLAAGGTWTATGWALSSGGAVAANNFPLAQDTVIIENTGLNTSATITVDVGWNIGAINASTRNNAWTFATGSQTPQIYKNFTLSSATTVTGTGVISFFGQGTTQTIDVNTATLTQPLTINAPTGTLVIAENTTTSLGVTLTAGTLDLSNNTLTCLTFSSSNSNTRAIAFGTGKIVVTGNNATVLSMSTATNFTYTGTPTVEFNYSGSTGTRLIIPVATDATESNALNIYVTTGTDTVQIGGSARFLNFDLTGFSGTLTYASNTRYFGNLTFSSGMTLGSIGSTGFTFLKSSGTQTITSAGKIINNGVAKEGAATLQLQDDLTLDSTRTFTLTAGTLDLNNLTLSTDLFSSSNSNTRAIAFGTGNITVTGNDATVWSMTTATNFTYTGTPTVNFTYSGSTGSRVVQYGGTAGGTEANAISINVTAGTDSFVNSGVYKNLNYTGFSGTLTSGTRTIYGNLTIPNTIVSNTSSTWTFAATSGIQQITTNGVTLNFPILQDGVGGTVSLADNLTIDSTRTFTLTNGALDVNDKTLTTGLFSSSNSNTRSIDLGTNGNITVNGGGWTATTSTGLSLTGTGTIDMTLGTAKTFAGGGATYPYTLNQGGLGTLTITGANTFTNISNTVQPTTIIFPASETTSVQNFTVSGTAGNLVTLNSSISGTQFTLALV